jgi:hypothetical protein
MQGKALPNVIDRLSPISQLQFCKDSFLSLVEQVLQFLRAGIFYRACVLPLNTWPALDGFVCSYYAQ